MNVVQVEQALGMFRTYLVECAAEQDWSEHRWGELAGLKVEVPVTVAGMNESVKVDFVHDVNPATSCCTAEFRLMKLPRMAGVEQLVMSAIPGTMRPDVVTNINVVTSRTSAR